MTLAKLIEELNMLNACDPECRGRCLRCPNELAREAAQKLTLMQAVLKDYSSSELLGDAAREVLKVTDS